MLILKNSSSSKLSSYTCVFFCGKNSIIINILILTASRFIAQYIIYISPIQFQTKWLNLITWDSFKIKTSTSEVKHLYKQYLVLFLICEWNGVWVWNCHFPYINWLCIHDSYVITLFWYHKVYVSTMYLFANEDFCHLSKTGLTCCNLFP